MPGAEGEPRGGKALLAIGQAVGLAALLFLRRLVTAPQNAVRGTNSSDEALPIGTNGSFVITDRFFRLWDSVGTIGLRISNYRCAKRPMPRSAFRSAGSKVRTLAFSLRTLPLLPAPLQIQRAAHPQAWPCHHLGVDLRSRNMDESPSPFLIRRLGANGIMLEAHHLADLVQQLELGIGNEPLARPRRLALSIYEPVFFINTYGQSLWQALFSPNDVLHYVQYDAHYLLGHSSNLL